MTSPARPGLPGRYWVPLAGIGVMVLVILVAMAAGYWSTSGRQLQGGAGGGRGPVAAGSLSPEGLKGWMTVEEACEGLGVEMGDFLAALGMPMDTPSETTLGNVEAVGLTMADVRVIAADLLDALTKPK